MSEFNQNHLESILIQINIPAAFDVLNSFNSEEQGEPYLIQIDGIQASIYFSRIYDFRYKNEFEIAPYSRMDEDRAALLSYSQVQIRFDKQILDSPNIIKDSFHVNPDQFLLAALPYLNKFISIYRKVTDQFWIRPIVLKDIFNFYFVLTDINGEELSAFTAIPSHHIVQFNGDKDFRLENTKDHSLRHSLLEDYYGFEDDMLFHMFDNFYLGYYNIALVQSVTFFENYVYSRLNKVLSKNKLDKIKKKPACGCMAGISEICTRGFLEHFEFDFAATEEWQNFRDITLRFRNKIVHGELLEQITQDHCMRAVIAARRAQQLLQKNVFNTI